MLSSDSKKIVEEAKSKGVWIFDPQYKKWYSPEDFAHTFNYANANDDFLKRLQLRHPNEGIEAGFKRLADIHLRLQVFVKVVMEYYKK
jgi:hypothetical protein